MNNSEIACMIAKKTKLPTSQVRKTLSMFKELIVEILNKGGKIKIAHFGCFEVVESKERLFKNPITKRHYISPKKKYIKIKLYKNFKFSVK